MSATQHNHKNAVVTTSGYYTTSDILAKTKKYLEKKYIVCVWTVSDREVHVWLCNYISYKSFLLLQISCIWT